MKTITKYSLISILLAGVAVLLSSCKKETPQQYQYSATFYVGGNVAGDAAYIYKDNELLYRLDDNAAISGIAVMDDGIYSCGSIWDWDAKPLPSTEPVIWKDGKRLDVDLGGAVGIFNNMVKRGTDWLCCGTITGEDGKHGIIIENGKVVFRSEDAVSFDCIGIGASGDYYVLANVDDGIELWQIDASKKMLVSSNMIAVNEDYEFWKGACMYVGEWDIAVGIWKTNQRVDQFHSYIWLSGNKRLVDLRDNSSVNELCFFNGYCLAGGCVLSEMDESGNPTSGKAVQWIVNGGPTMQDFSIGRLGNSDLRLMMNYDDQFLFQGVQHDGGVQICDDGKMFEEIKTLNGFNANCWDVTVEKIPVVLK